jgi:TonB family protein
MRTNKSIYLMATTAALNVMTLVAPSVTLGAQPAVSSLKINAAALLPAINAAAAGDQAQVERFFAKPPAQLSAIPMSAKRAALLEGLKRAHDASKVLFRAKKYDEAAKRVQLYFRLIAFVQSGETPDQLNWQPWFDSAKKLQVASDKVYLRALNDYGFYLQNCDRDAEAAAVFKEVIAQWPTREVAYLNLADSLWKTGKQSEAMPLYKKYKVLMASENLTSKVPSRVEQNLSTKAAIEPSASRDVDFGPYMAEMQKRIRHNWHPPAKTEAIRNVVVFRVNKTGKVYSAKIDVPSKFSDYDKAALNAVALTLPPLPSGSPEFVDVQFTFDYHVTDTSDPKWMLVSRWRARVKEASTADNHIGLAQAYQNNGDLDQALTEYETAIDMKPTNDYYKQLLAACRKQRGARP